MLVAALTMGHYYKNSTATNALPSSFATKLILQEFIVHVRVFGNFIPYFNKAVVID